jgi:ubiquinone/menaquinone biosynthesis C-methylase UbiE
MTKNNPEVSKMVLKRSKGYKGLGMEGFIAKWYAKNTGRDTEEYKKDAKRVAEKVPEGGAVLEVAPGPGYLAIELARLGNYQIAGLDISKSFVRIAQMNAREAGVEIEFRHGDAARMPFDDEIFDGIICRAAFKNFKEPIAALDEMYRVLKPNGKALILDLRGDVSQAAIDELVNNMGLNRLNTLITGWTFKFMLIKRAYTKEKFKELVSKTRFRRCEIREDSIGLEILLEKRSTRTWVEHKEAVT